MTKSLVSKQWIGMFLLLALNVGFCYLVIKFLVKRVVAWRFYTHLFVSSVYLSFSVLFPFNSLFFMNYQTVIYRGHPKYCRWAYHELEVMSFWKTDWVNVKCHTGIWASVTAYVTILWATDSISEARCIYRGWSCSLGRTGWKCCSKYEIWSFSYRKYQETKTRLSYRRTVWFYQVR